jgi:hypothetical protein
VGTAVGKGEAVEVGQGVGTGVASPAVPQEVENRTVKMMTKVSREGVFLFMAGAIVL